ncbi:MAG: biotin transporter BioY [Pseudomonadota bacterium]
MTVLSTIQSPISNSSKFGQTALRIVGGVLLLAFAAQLSIPMQPVPLTFQSSAVILIAMMFGARQGALVILAYLAAGCCGLPVFANFSAGPMQFVGPTAGYLLGFLPAAYLTGYLLENGWQRNIITRFLAALAGASVIFILGVTVLSKFTGGWQSAFAFGAAPFLISEPIKLAAVAVLTSRRWKNN